MVIVKLFIIYKCIKIKQLLLLDGIGYSYLTLLFNVPLALFACHVSGTR